MLCPAISVRLRCGLVAGGGKADVEEGTGPSRRRALTGQGPVQVALPLPLRLRYGLSPQGREFAIERGYLPKLQVR